MNTYTKGTATIFLLLVLALIVSGCIFERVDVGPLQTDDQTIELGDADSAEVDIDLGAGLLDMSGGVSGLMEATFTYNVADMEPEVNYSVSGGVGNLSVQQPETGFRIPTNLDEFRYEWDLRFNEDTPLDMRINIGAGEGQIDLSSLTLNNLNFEGGAGEVNLDLSGGTLSDLDVAMGAGEVTIDLSGDWGQDLEAAIKGGVGKLTIILPSGVGVRVEVQGGIGSTNASGFTKDGDVYTNDAYGESEVTLTIEVESGVGEINLELAE